VLTEAHVNKMGSKWTVSRLRASIGRTDLTGELTFDDGHSAGRRPNYRATLRSTVFDINDVAPLMGMASSPTAKVVSTDHGLPRGNIDAERMRNFDAEVDLNILKLARAALDLAQNLQMRATLQDGVLNLNSLDFGAVGGHVNGTVHFDGSRKPAEATLDLQAHGLHLDSLSSALSETQRLTGELDGRVAMHSQGESIAALVGTASGSLSAALINATISNRLDAQLGLNGAGLLRALFAGAKRVPIRCAMVAIDFVRGEGKTRHLAFETERTELIGSGSISLAHESFDAVIMPQPRHGSLFVLNRAIHASGSFRAANVELVDPLARSAPDSCALGRQSRVGQLAPIGLSERQSQAALKRGSW
jgi:AsmA family protein